MSRVGWVEKTIFDLEGIKIDFVNNGRKVRSEVDLAIKLFCCKSNKEFDDNRDVIANLKSQ